MARDEWLLEVDDLVVEYGSVLALRGVTYRVARGQVVALLGGNASGKSTSLKAILGVIRPQSGRIGFRGQPIGNLSTVARVALGIGVVPEGRRLFARMSVEDNLLVGCRFSGGIAHDRLDEVYSSFPDVKAMRSVKAGLLSGGQQQMVALGRALMSDPGLLLLDEPCMGLSPALVSRTMDLIVRMKESGRTVFLVEQNAGAVLSVADYAYVLREGEVWIEGTGRAVMSDPQIVEAYLGVVTTE